MKALTLAALWSVGLCLFAAQSFAFHPIFYTRIDFPVGGREPRSMCTADFDGDGALDLATSNFDNGNVSILRNNGNGTFGVADNYGVGSGPLTIFATDVDKDGHPDIVVANYSSNDISVLKNNGNGTFGTATNYGVGISWPYSLCSADFDADGWPDIAVANSGTNTVSMLKNHGDGTFADGVSYTCGSNPHSVCAADFDGDGSFDLAVADYAADSVSILKNNGNGTFAALVSYKVGSGPWYVLAANFGADAKLDLVAVNYGSNTVSVLINDGSGAFGTAVDYPSGGRSLCASSGDLDSDGDIDLIVPSIDVQSVSILKNNGVGTFAAPVSYAIENEGWAACVGDLDGNGKPDVAVGNRWPMPSVSVFMNDGNGGLRTPPEYGVDNPQSITSADFNGDGQFDVATANWNSNAISTLKGNGDGTFEPAINYAVGSHPISIATADVTSDGKPDLAVVNYSSGTVSVLRNNGNGEFGNRLDYFVGSCPISIAAGDLDGNGSTDLAVANFCSNNISILLNDGAGTFNASANYSAGLNPYSLQIADIDGDGKKDVIDVCTGDAGAYFFKNNGNGTFSSGVYSAIGGSPRFVCVHDVNMDGKPDLIIANGSNNPYNWGAGVRVLINSGSGTFSTLAVYSPGYNPYSLAVTDFDGDGLSEVAVGNAGSANISIMEINGDGTLTLRNNYGVNGGMLSICAADFNGDGKTDLGVALYAKNAITVLLNQSVPSIPLFDTTSTTDTANVFFVKQADMDLDNNPDIVFTGNSSDSLFIIYGKPNGTLEKQRSYLNIKNAAIAIDFINGDTLLDIAARTMTKLYVLLNLGGRNFSIDSMTTGASPMVYSPNVATFPTITTGYFDGDAKKDIVVNPGVLLSGNGLGQFPSNQTLPFTLDFVGTADFNGDGRDDIIATNGDSARIYLNNGTGAFTLSAATRIGYRAYDVVSLASDIDLNNDGKPDVALVTGISTGTNDTSVVTLIVGNGTGGVASSQAIPIVGSALSLSVADIDKDKNLDISVVNSTTKDLTIYSGNGLGGVIATLKESMGANPVLSLVATDLNRSGSVDFVVGGQAGSPILTALNQLPPDPIRPEEMVATGYGNISISEINPQGRTISRGLSTVAGSAFGRSDFDGDGVIDQRTWDYNLQDGEYMIVIRPNPGTTPPGPVFSTDIRINGSDQLQSRVFHDYRDAWGSLQKTADAAAFDSLIFYFKVESVSSIKPNNGVRTHSPRPGFAWDRLIDSSGVLKYQFQLDRYYDLRAPIYDDSSLTAPRFFVNASLGLDSVYYWRVRAKRAGGWDLYSRTFAAYIGPGCCLSTTGNTDGSPDDVVDISDVFAVVDYLGASIPLSSCSPENDVNIDGTIDISDLFALIDYLSGTAQLPPCA